MNVDKVQVLKTLKLGNGLVVMPGTIFPNPEFPEIPREVRLELRLDRGTVRALQLTPKPAAPIAAEAIQIVSEAILAPEPTTPPQPAPQEENAPVEQIEAVPDTPEPPVAKVKTKRTRKPITTK